MSSEELQTIIDKLKNENTTQPTNYLPYILGGVGIVAVIILVVALVNNKKSRRY